LREGRRDVILVVHIIMERKEANKGKRGAENPESGKSQ
jgi:hypothetical protein